MPRPSNSAHRWDRQVRHSEARAAQSGGFTLVEIVVVVALIGVAIGIVAPNLGALVPSARLDGSASQLRRQIDWVRSEARIQAKRMILEIDLDHARWRYLEPPEERLTSEQEIVTTEDMAESDFGWEGLEKGVIFLGAGDARHGMADKGIYRMIFDEYGATADQLIVMTLDGDPQMIWSLHLTGLTGQVQIEKSETGEKPHPQLVEEGAF